ncbi:rRNA maturation endonuclease Nob1 [Clostridium beijerinckii]|nr:rRNA maturation endonuclease Nob1 [Clostridium beijerinckii]
MKNTTQTPINSKYNFFYNCKRCYRRYRLER